LFCQEKINVRPIPNPGTPPQEVLKNGGKRASALDLVANNQLQKTSGVPRLPTPTIDVPLRGLLTQYRRKIVNKQ
jgi:hypothetical protein